MKRSAIVGAILTIALSLISASAYSQSAPAPVPLPFTLTANGQSSQLFATSSGQSTCSVVVTNAGAGLVLVPQATSNAIGDITSGAAQWSAVTSIGGGSIGSFGSYTGNIASTGLTFFRVVATTVGAVPVTGSIVCSNALGLGSGGGGGGTTGSVTAAGTNGTLAQAVQGITGGVPVAISGSITATASYPYLGLVPQAQATAPSFLGTGCTYNSAGITAATTTQFVPCQSDAQGNRKVAVVAPYGSASAAPIANTFSGVSGFDGTNVRPVAIDPTTGYLLTKSGASVNGTYGSPNTTVTASATSVQYEQGTGPNGSFVVNTPAPYVAPTCAAAPNAPCVQITGPLPSLASGSNTIGSIANTTFGITGNSAVNIGSATGLTGLTAISAASFVYGLDPAGYSALREGTAGVPAPTAVPGILYVQGTGTNAAIPVTAQTTLPVSIATTVPVSVATTLPVSLATLPPLAAGTATIGSIANTAFGITGTVTTNPTYPYSLATNGQTATAGSGIGILGVYTAANPTLTNGQAAPVQLASNGAIESSSAICSTGGGLQCLTVGNYVSGDASSFANAIPVVNAGFGWNGSSFDRLRTAGVGNSVASTGISAAAPYLQYNSSLPTVASGNYTAAQSDSSGRLLISPTGLPTPLATQPVSGTVTASNTTFGTSAVTGGGATRVLVTTITTAAVQALCTTACTAYDLSAINSTAAACYIQEYNTASGGVTVGTTAPVRILYVAAGTEAADNIPPTIGLAFGTAWSAAATTTPTGATTCGASVYLQADKV